MARTYTTAEVALIIGKAIGRSEGKGVTIPAVWDRARARGLTGTEPYPGRAVWTERDLRILLADVPAPPRKRTGEG